MYDTPGIDRPDLHSHAVGPFVMFVLLPAECHRERRTVSAFVARIRPPPPPSKRVRGPGILPGHKARPWQNL